MQQKAERLAARGTRPPIAGQKKVGQKPGTSTADMAIAGQSYIKTLSSVITCGGKEILPKMINLYEWCKGTSTDHEPEEIEGVNCVSLIVIVGLHCSEVQFHARK